MLSNCFNAKMKPLCTKTVYFPIPDAADKHQTLNALSFLRGLLDLLSSSSSPFFIIPDTAFSCCIYNRHKQKYSQHPHDIWQLHLPILTSIRLRTQNQLQLILQYTPHLKYLLHLVPTWIQPHKLSPQNSFRIKFSERCFFFFARTMKCQHYHHCTFCRSQMTLYNGFT